MNMGAPQQNHSAARGLSDGPAGERVEKIAHDFNNILTLVLGYGEKLVKMLPENHPGHDFAQEVCRAAREGERLSHELGSLAKSVHEAARSEPG